MKHRVAFVDGLVFDSTTESFQKVNIFCEDGYIVDMCQDTTRDGYTVISLGGKHIIPGLVDVHTHGICGNDFNFASEEQVEQMCKAYARNGTTSVMATLASAGFSKLMNSIFAINPNRLSSKAGHANLIGIHMEGRYLNPSKKGAHNLEYLALPNLEELDTLAQAMMPSPLHFSIAPELEGGEAFIKKAKEYGATVGVAHTNATYDEAMTALSWGATSFTHTFNAMTPIHHRMPGTATCALTADSAYAEVICDGMHLHPAIVRLIYKAKPTDKLVLITDSMAGAGAADGEYTIAGTSVIVKNGCAVDENGTLAGSTLTMFKALKNFMSFCGLPLNKAIRFATTNPASMVGALFVGKLEKCYRADFIVLTDVSNPEIDEVYVGGRKVENE